MNKCVFVVHSDIKSTLLTLLFAPKQNLLIPLSKNFYMQATSEKVYNSNSVFILNIWRIKWDGAILTKQNSKLEKLVKLKKKNMFSYMHVFCIYVPVKVIIQLKYNSKFLHSIYILIFK